MSKIYISGKIRNCGNYRSRFHECHKKLEKKFPGCHVINPVEIGEDVKLLTGKDNPEWCEYMKHDIRELVFCDMICMLTNWKDSPGAKVEKKIAETIGLEIIFEEELDERKRCVK